MCISVNNDFAALRYGQENDPVFVFSLWYLAPRSLTLDVLKSPILLLLQLPQYPYQQCREYNKTIVYEYSKNIKNHTIQTYWLFNGRSGFFSVV